MTTNKARERRPSVVLVGTLDTKGKEYAYFRERIRECGVDVLLIDAGILGEPLTETDVTRQAVAAAAWVDVQELADAHDRTTAIATMGRGAAEVVRRLYAEGQLGAIGALGGSCGTALATRAMRALPVGVPKLIHEVAVIVQGLIADVSIVHVSGRPGDLGRVRISAQRGWSSSAGGRPQRSPTESGATSRRPRRRPARRALPRPR